VMSREYGIERFPPADLLGENDAKNSSYCVQTWTALSWLTKPALLGLTKTLEEPQEELLQIFA
jgi:hypothetical protein